MTQLNI